MASLLFGCLLEANCDAKVGITAIVGSATKHMLVRVKIK